MNKFLDKYRVESNRLKGRDYTAEGFYFITISAYQKENLFGEVQNKKMVLNEVGKIVEAEWCKTSQIRRNVELDKFVVMPNHLHGILIINNRGGSRKDVETPRRGVSTATNKLQPHHLAWKSNSLGSIINQFKSVCTKRIQQIQPALSKIWQAGYHDRIIRNEAEYNRIQSYILTNPENWEKDEIFR